MQRTLQSLDLGRHQDLARLTRPYTLLITIPIEPSSATTISYWAPPEFQPHHFQLRTTLKPAQIQLVQSHEDHGIVRIAAREPDLANFFHQKLEHLQTSSHDANMVSKLVANLRCEEVNEGAALHIFSIQILGDESGNLVPEGCSLLWKWAKEQSPYRKSGSWDHRLVQVLVDAEWTAGKSIVILAKGVDEEEYERVVKGAIKS
ncbi:hypothetical protein COCCADRAFT_37226 [Bipolaris zeicola 26-R-13]|uniref:Uncharacterized protein n=1 Tax=Cochliobolus carbonum (strain 26-R-13) TaxID=930089 RepID=W6YBJ5_COCC2|nr:uncharacterized protein COCCADRAFT_37226 [Bipolaris zeicola 26-R-13]EUC32874.1 hypothetical protein COCCADRAFT_37226 [Bipolaris zeicola 26-R-13]